MNTLGGIPIVQNVKLPDDIVFINLAGRNGLDDILPSEFEHIINLLNGDGVRTAYVMEKLNCRRGEATKYLHAIGARYCSKSRMWRLPNVRRLENCKINFRWSK